jgi:hypothetical protein
MPRREYVRSARRLYTGRRNHEKWIYDLLQASKRGSVQDAFNVARHIAGTLRLDDEPPLEKVASEMCILIQQLRFEFSSELVTIQRTVSSWNNKGMSHHHHKTKKAKLFTLALADDYDVTYHPDEESVQEQVMYEAKMRYSRT